MLKEAFILLGLCAIALAAHPRIVGGSDAGNREFPYQVSIQLRNGTHKFHYCGGAILAENAVLSAASCLGVVTLPPGVEIDLVVGLRGMNDEGPNVQVSSIAKSNIHPDFTSPFGGNDVVVHILTTPFTFNDFVGPISLPPAGEVPTGDAVLTGWGSTSTGDEPTYAETLQKVTLPLISAAECQNSWIGSHPPIFPTQICAGPLSGGSGSCTGDFGNPLAQDGVIVGINTWGSLPCGGAMAPSVFTRVSAYTEFINEQLDNAKTYLN